MTLPPGHYGRAGREVAARRVSTEPVRPLSWRWFVPRSRLGSGLFGATALLFVALVLVFGSSGAAWFGAFAFFHMVLGVATRRMPYLGRLGRLGKADPLGTAHLLDARSRQGAVAGTAIALGVSLGIVLLGLVGLAT